VAHTLRALRALSGSSRLNVGDATLCGQVESAEDVTFNTKTSGACAADKLKFCAAVTKGGGRVMACLAEHQDEPGFSPLCDSPPPAST
jgi:hypothetical protein